MKRATRLLGVGGAILALLWLPHRWPFARGGSSTAAQAASQAMAEDSAVSVTREVVVPVVVRAQVASRTAASAETHPAFRRRPRGSLHQERPRTGLARWLLGDGRYQPSPFPQPKTSRTGKQ